MKSEEVMPGDSGIRASSFFSHYGLGISYCPDLRTESARGLAQSKTLARDTNAPRKNGGPSPHPDPLPSHPMGAERGSVFGALRRDRQQADAGPAFEGSAISESQVAGQTDVPFQSGVALRLPPHSKTLARGSNGPGKDGGPTPHPDRMNQFSPHNPHPVLRRDHPLPLPPSPEALRRAGTRARDNLPVPSDGRGEGIRLRRATTGQAAGGCGSRFRRVGDFRESGGWANGCAVPKRRRASLAAALQDAGARFEWSR